MNRARLHPAGFSLLELVVVIVVMGTIAAIAIPRFSYAAANARESACRADLRTYVSALEQYHGIEGSWPTGLTPSLLDLRALPASPFGGSISNPVYREPSGDTSLQHPAQKRFRPDNPAAKTWWYNPANGAFRALVPETGDATWDLALYARLNGRPDDPPDLAPVDGELSASGEVDLLR